MSTQDWTEKAEKITILSSKDDMLALIKEGLRLWGVSIDIPERHIIIREVASHYNLTQAIIMGRSKTRPVVTARMMCCYLMARLRKDSYCSIGRHMKLDHSTVIHACNTITKKAKDNDEIRNAIEVISEKIGYKIKMPKPLPVFSFAEDNVKCVNF